ncbi:hypothetical protein I312_101223 [Cryptococcus bacillisporus CA1280]|uniref:uncharacterized protein n=1 Tax=Cryptococcus bacillisporus CA1280 TaxID=1296109 RepID=UPI00336691F3
MHNLSVTQIKTLNQKVECQIGHTTPKRRSRYLIGMISGMRSAAKFGSNSRSATPPRALHFQIELHVYTHILLPSIKKRQKGMNAKADDDYGDKIPYQGFQFIVCRSEKVINRKEHLS